MTPPIDESIIECSLFEQVLEMDEDDERSFSVSLVQEFIEQAKDTFKKMDASLKENDLHQLSRLGHFLKGSSAALGIFQLRAICERIQYIGEKKTEETLSDQQAVDKIAALVKEARLEFEKASDFYAKFYNF